MTYAAWTDVEKFAKPAAKIEDRAGPDASCVVDVVR